MKISFRIKTIFFACLLYSSSSIGAILNISNGTLFGASDVDVNGVLYDVAFREGTCAELFNGCDQNSDFTFSNPTNNGALINAAMLALLEQVFIETPSYAFDSNPALTNGCFDPLLCSVFTPLFLSGGGNSLGLTSSNNTSNIANAQVGSLDHIGAGSGLVTFDTTAADRDLSVYAVWTQTTVVPVPASLVLFLSGFAALGGFLKRPRKA